MISKDEAIEAKLLRKHDEIKLTCNGNAGALPLPKGEGWGEGMPSLDRPETLTRIASCDAIRPLPGGKR
jgi:hypothetical protein